jgi:Ca2+/H+ antiporter|uniref:Uncharacterized protein n=1 Tax=Picea glauca TaxID=3330 RepID=A0A124GMP0_PICGL|nr:hypothetical protein ABT39_MTgene1773 [Picea glauca]
MCPTLAAGPLAAIILVIGMSQVASDVVDRDTASLPSASPFTDSTLLTLANTAPERILIILGQT